MKGSFTHSALCVLLLAGVVMMVPAGQVMAQNATFIDRDVSATHSVRTEVRTYFTGVGAAVDNTIFLPDAQTQVTRQTASGDFLVNLSDLMTGQERILIARGVRLTHTENVPVLVSVNTGVPLQGQFVQAEGRQTRSMWLNDGSLNPGNARPIDNGRFVDLPIHESNRLIRNFDEYTQRLDAFLILETEVDVSGQEGLRGHPDIGYTVEVVIEY